GGYAYDDRRGYDAPPLTYYERRTTPNSNYEYRSSYSSSTTTYGDARYNAYSDRSRCCDEPRRESYDSYGGYGGHGDHDRYEAPLRDYDRHHDRYDRY